MLRYILLGNAYESYDKQSKICFLPSIAIAKLTLCRFYSFSVTFFNYLRCFYQTIRTVLSFENNIQPSSLQDKIK